MPDQPTPEELQAHIQALQRQLAELQAQQQATAQQGSAAATGGSIAIAGSGNVVVNELPREVLELFARQFGFDPNASDGDAVKAYFDLVVFKRHSKLSFSFVRPERGEVYTESDVEVERVFVPLRMTDPDALERQARLARHMESYRGLPREVEEAARPITLPELVNKYRCFLLRGKPGCGKTTLLRHIALSFARGEQHEKLGWQGPAPLPLMVSLRNFGAFLKSPKGRDITEPGPLALLTYLGDHLRSARVGFPPGFLERRLENGECFLLLDALDEASGALDGGGDLRLAVAQQVSFFIEHYQDKGNRFALSSRPHAFQDEGDLRRMLRQPKVCDVFDLDPEGYRRLITNLLVVLTNDPGKGRDEARDLFERIQANPHLVDLAGNPLLCTTLVLVYKYTGCQLPERRVDVLHEIVTLLLGRWELQKREVGGPDKIAEWGDLASMTGQTIESRQRALEALAWKMQRDHAPELSARDAVRELAQFYCVQVGEQDSRKQDEWARAFLNAAHERSGLFIAVDEGVYAFAHQAFREYLAASRLYNTGEAALIQEILAHAPEPDDWWDQVVLFSGAHPKLSDAAANQLIQLLREKNRVDYCFLAARCAHDMMRLPPGPQQRELQKWLVEAMQNSSKLPDRALAGRALALAGDPRPGVGVISPPLSLATGEGTRAGALPDIWWADLPSGTLLMGSRKGETFQTSRGQEKPYDAELWPDGNPRAVPIQAFKLAAYPITVAQFRPFVDDPQGWANDEWWTAAGLRDRGDSKTPGYWNDPQWHIDNHPVVGVTWYAAVAYCNWLTARLRAAGRLAVACPGGQARETATTNLVIRLPTEAEWEWAARGPVERRKGEVTSPLRWPWGDGWRADACNSSESQIGRTSAVGLFPSGVNWKGNVYDLAGNVWEWCATRWQKYGDDYPALEGADEWTDDYLAGNDARVFRGGSFDSDARDLRGAYRDWDVPWGWDTDGGFRCVCASGSSSEF